MNLSVLENTYAVCRLSPTEPFPVWIDQRHFWTITKTQDELSVLCVQACVPAGIKAETEWRIIKVEGPLDFGLTGILASIAHPLAAAKISIFAISTFDTDYVLVREKYLEAAKQALMGAGFSFLS